MHLQDKWADSSDDIRSLTANPYPGASEARPALIA